MLKKIELITARPIARLMTVAHEQISHGDAVVVATIEQAVSQPIAPRDLFDRFQTMIRSKVRAALEGWIEMPQPA